MLTQAIIVGAGFSSYVELPLQAGFTTVFLRASRFSKGSSKRLAEFLCPLVGDTFHPRENFDADRLPDLDDLFPYIDLSANSGHHLGPKHSPATLLTTRHALIVYTIRMLLQSYDNRKEQPDEQWAQLETLLSYITPDQSAFISLNWT